MNGPDPVEVLRITIVCPQPDGSIVLRVEYQPQNQPGIGKCINLKLDRDRISRLASDLMTHIIGPLPPIEHYAEAKKEPE